jgi:hypothetical protein
VTDFRHGLKFTAIQKPDFESSASAIPPLWRDRPFGRLHRDAVWRGWAPTDTFSSGIIAIAAGLDNPWLSDRQLQNVACDDNFLIRLVKCHVFLRKGSSLFSRLITISDFSLVARWRWVWRWGRPPVSGHTTIRRLTIPHRLCRA